MQIADIQRSRDLQRLLASLREAVPDIARDVTDDLGAGATSSTTTPVVERFLAAVAAGGSRVGAADLVRLRAEGAAAARQGQPLASPIDAYLSTAWVAWDHALRIVPTPDPEVLGALGAALLRAGDDIAAALADGFTEAERALAATAAATRQAILEELLTPAAAGSAASGRRLRRATLVGIDPALPYHVLVIRPEVDAEGLGVLVQELDRRLARDPARRPHMVAARGGDLVAIAAPPWRDGQAFAEAVASLAPGTTWWAVAAGPVPLDGLASAYADAVDAMRVVPAVSVPREVVALGDVALERALVADPGLAADAVERWLGPLERAGRGGPELVRTLESWFASGESVVACARAIGVAPRTVSYRLDRIANILGVPSLDARLRSRLVIASLARRLLTASPVADHDRDG